MSVGRVLLVGLVGATMAWTGMAVGQTKPTCNSQIAKGSTPERVAGEVVKIDQATGRVTIREADGKTYEFTADKSTLQSLKVGDRLEATLRTPAC